MDADWHEQSAEDDEQLDAFSSRVTDGLGIAAAAMLSILSFVNGVIALGLSSMALGFVAGMGAGVAEGGPGANIGGYTPTHLAYIASMLAALCVLLLPFVSAVSASYSALLLLRGGRRWVLYFAAGLSVLGPLVFVIAAAASIGLLGSSGLLLVCLAGILLCLAMLASGLAVVSVSRSPYPTN